MLLNLTIVFLHIPQFELEIRVSEGSLYIPMLCKMLSRIVSLSSHFVFKN